MTANARADRDARAEDAPWSSPRERLGGDLQALNEFARELAQIGGGGENEFIGAGDRSLFPRRVNADPESVERGLARLVLTIVDLLRRLMEKQALRRIEAGSLSDEQIERMGETFLRLDAKMIELKAMFGLKDEDLNLDLGPLGRLLPDDTD